MLRMSQENLQTVIVSKTLAATRSKAERLARPYARSTSDVRETDASWLFRQRAPSDFLKRSFRASPLLNSPGITLVHGKLRRARNPLNQRQLGFRGGDDQDQLIAEHDYWMTLSHRLRKVRTAAGLQKMVAEVEAQGIKSDLIKTLVKTSIAAKARGLGISSAPSSTENDGIVYKRLLEKRIGNPGRIQNKSTPKKKAPAKKAPKHIKLRSPKRMPDPGPCAWLGSIIEWGWVMDLGESSKKLDDKGNAIWDPKSEWMFMWSPKYKAIVAIKRPQNMYKQAGVSRFGGAAKMFEVFMARGAENTFEIDVPDVKLHKIGKKAAHVVYRSNKWSPTRKESDYIHQLGDGVQIYCGPSIDNPEVFICFGGKLTLTARGLVW